MQTDEQENVPRQHRVEWLQICAAAGLTLLCGLFVSSLATIKASLVEAIHTNTENIKASIERDIKFEARVNEIEKYIQYNRGISEHNTNEVKELRAELQKQWREIDGLRTKRRTE